jgi:hypothetical protein
LFAFSPSSPSVGFSPPCSNHPPLHLLFPNRHLNAVDDHPPGQHPGLFYSFLLLSPLSSLLSPLSSLLSPLSSLLSPLSSLLSFSSLLLFLLMLFVPVCLLFSSLRLTGALSIPNVAPQVRLHREEAERRGDRQHDDGQREERALSSAAEKRLQESSAIAGQRTQLLGNPQFFFFLLCFCVFFPSPGFGYLQLQYSRLSHHGYRLFASFFFIFLLLHDILLFCLYLQLSRLPHHNQFIISSFFFF